MSRVFGPLRQNGYVVRDIHAAMRSWIDQAGIGPWFYFDRVEIDWFRHRGAACELEVSIALANSGDLQIELIQQHNDAPSLYREFLDAGFEGLQHVAFWTEDYAGLCARAGEVGLRLGHEGQIGGERGRFAYFETGGPPGSVIEIADIGGSKGRFFDHVRRASLGWDGADAIRPVGSGRRADAPRA